MIVPVYQSEISPAENRGQLACIEFTGNIVGYASSVVSIAVSTRYAELTIIGNVVAVDWIFRFVHQVGSILENPSRYAVHHRIHSRDWSHLHSRIPSVRRRFPFLLCEIDTLRIDGCSTRIKTNWACEY